MLELIVNRRNGIRFPSSSIGPKEAFELTFFIMISLLALVV